MIHGVEVSDSCAWISAARNTGIWYLGVEKGAEELKDTWRREYKQESDPFHTREAAPSRAANLRAATANTTIERADQESRTDMAERVARFILDKG